MKSQDIYLNDIIKYAKKVIEFTKDLDLQKFEKDEKTYLAVIRCIEVIGEAAKNIDESTRNKYQNISWKDAARMQDVHIHNYSGVSADVVWETVIKDIPVLLNKLEKK